MQGRCIRERKTSEKGFFWRELQGIKHSISLPRGEGRETGRSVPYLKLKGRTLREPPTEPNECLWQFEAHRTVARHAPGKHKSRGLGCGKGAALLESTWANDASFQGTRGGPRGKGSQCDIA